ncbi:hypothetical protein ACRRVD_01265 [Candidatus Cardinium hertigii]|uniref:hypothetical protein n=1 Tax=Candidatus Cardinium hertigii TaxID=247481 RepID=UPI003D7DF08B
MFKKLLLYFGAILGGLLVWRFMSNRQKTKSKGQIYDRTKRATLSIVAKPLLKRCVKKIVAMLLQ